jgi:hypothetical protein
VRSAQNRLYQIRERMCNPCLFRRKYLLFNKMTVRHAQLRSRTKRVNVQHLTDWTAIKARKQQIIHNNNQIENLKQIPHHYQVGDLVMLQSNRANKYEQPYSGPYHITQVNTNGTVCLKINAVTDTVKI